MAGTQGRDDSIIHLVTEKNDSHRSWEAELGLKRWAAEPDWGSLALDSGVKLQKLIIFTSRS